MSDSDSPLMIEILKGMRADNAALRADVTSGFAELRSDMTSGFAELRADMTSGFAELRSDMNRGFAEVRGEMTRGFAEVRGEIEQTNERLGSLEGRVDRMSEAMVRGFTAVHERIDGTNERLDDLCEEQRRTNTRLDGLRDISGEKWRDLDQRVGTIETRLDRIDRR